MVGLWGMVCTKPNLTTNRIFKKKKQLSLPQNPNSGPTRFSKPTDLLLALLAPFLAPDKVYAKDHPYFVNYQGMKNLAAAAREAGVPKFIRVSGLSGKLVAWDGVDCRRELTFVQSVVLWALSLTHPSIYPSIPLTRKKVGYSAFNPVTILLNVVVSFAVRWQVRSCVRVHALVVYHDRSIGLPKPTPICPSPSNETNTQTKQLAAEQALRDSGVDYTVIRPGALVDCAATPDDLVRMPVRSVCGCACGRRPPGKMCS